MKSGIAMRAATVNVLYDHVLRLAPEGKVGLTSGEVTNLIATGMFLCPCVRIGNHSLSRQESRKGGRRISHTYTHNISYLSIFLSIFCTHSTLRFLSAVFFRIDTQKLYEVMQDGHLVWGLPLSVLVVTLCLWLVMGPTTLMGLAILLLFVPLVRYVMTTMLAIRHERAQWTDRRMKLINSMIQGVR